MRWAMALGIVLGGLVAEGGAGAGAQEPTTTTTATPAAGLGGEVTVAEVATAVSQDGWYAHPGAVGDREQLDLLAERLALQGNPMGFALLDSEPTGGSTRFAEEVLDALLGQGDRRIRTVLVLSDADVGLVSDVWGDQSIDDALDATIDELRADPTDGLEALADALAAEPTLDEEDSSSGDDGGGGSSSAWIGAGVIVVVVLMAARRFLPGAEGSDGGYGYDDTSDSSWSRRRRRSFTGSSFRRSSSSRSRRSSGSSRRSSSGSRRGRGGRRL